MYSTGKCRVYTRGWVAWVGLLVVGASVWWLSEGGWGLGWGEEGCTADQTSPCACLERIWPKQCLEVYCDTPGSASLFLVLVVVWVVGAGFWFGVRRGAQRIRPPPVLSGENLTQAMRLRSIVIHLVGLIFFWFLLQHWKKDLTTWKVNDAWTICKIYRNLHNE